MQQGATEEQIQNVIDRLVELDFNVHRSTGVMHTVLGGVGGRADFDLAIFEVMEGVKEAHRIISPYKLASRVFRPAGTVVQSIGSEQIIVMAGPAEVESAEQIEICAEVVAKAGARVLRGSPSRLLRDAADRHGLLAVAEVEDLTQVPQVSELADILMVASRNMQNFS